MIRIEITDYLSEAARLIREEVFVKEQGFKVEFDNIDETASCVVLYETQIPIACCRYFEGNEAGEYVVGRLAVRKEYRGRHLGEQMLELVEKAVKDAGGRRVSLSAQVQAEGFYEKQGYLKIGDIYYDEHCEHIHMEKNLQ
ncbi:MAG: GNAT family N-acetyltransferase [Bacteroides sp.]|nr:GNAT family N-acetyltransferase [Bacteroides sp.]MCM1549717.1 GNAT family N-acetyltransferase [Clostridium sp.]